MPIYEYKCQKCAGEFEVLVRGDEAVTCQHCNSRAVQKKLSVFAVGTAKSNKTAPSCACGGFEAGRCGSGMCGV